MGIRRSAAQSSVAAIVACAAVAAIVTSGCHSGANARADGGSAGRPDGAGGSPDMSSAGSAGGGGGAAGEVLISPPRPLPTIVDVQPLDLSTARDGKIRVLAWNSGLPLGAELIAALSSSFVVRTWPEQELVPLDATATDAQATQFAQIVLTPRASLEARWYELVARLPDEVTWPAGGTAGLLPLEDGSLGARFRVGSLPLVVGMVIYAKSADVQSVYVALSETVPAASLPVPTISSGDGAPSSCAFEKPSGSSQLPTLRFTCRGDLDLGRAIQLALDPIAGEATALEGGQATTFTISPADWMRQADGGMFWKRRYP